MCSSSNLTIPKPMHNDHNDTCHAHEAIVVNVLDDKYLHELTMIALCQIDQLTPPPYVACPIP